MEAIRQNGKIILHSNDGTSMKMIFKKTEFLFDNTSVKIYRAKS